MNNETEFIFDELLTQNFTIVPNDIIDYELTDKAIGLYLRILKVRNIPNWKIYQSSFVNKRNGKDAVASSMKELIAAGFIERIQIKENGKMAGVQYKVFGKSIFTKDQVEENLKKLSEKKSKKTKKTKIEKNKNEKAESVENTNFSPKPENPVPVIPTSENPELKRKSGKKKESKKKDISFFHSNNNKRVTYCSMEDPERIEGMIEDIRNYTAGSYNDREIKKFINAAFGDTDLIKDIYDNVMARDPERKPIKNIVNYIVGAIKKER